MHVQPSRHDDGPEPAVRGFRHRLGRLTLLAALVTITAACTPTVKVATDEPITINLNVNIKHEIRVKVDKQLDDVFDNEELF